MWMCAAMVAVGLVAVVVTGNAVAFLPAIGCVLMMAVMMLLMGGAGRGGHHGGNAR